MADLHTDPESLPVSCMIRGRLRGLLRERDDARVRAERAEDTLSLVQQQRDQAVARAEQAEREATQLRAAESRRLAPGALTEPPMRSEGAERMQHVFTTYWDFGDTPRGLSDALLEDGYRIVRDGGER